MFSTLRFITAADGKHLVASLFGKGSLVMIGVIAGIALIAVLAVNLQKKKSGSKGEKKDE